MDRVRDFFTSVTKDNSGCQEPFALHVSMSPERNRSLAIASLFHPDP